MKDLIPLGTRVRVVPLDCIDEHDNGSDACEVADMKGTIVDANNGFGYVSVEFDEPIPCGEGHDCEGKAKDGHGWNVMAKYLIRIQNNTPEYLAWCEYDQMED